LGEFVEGDVHPLDYSPALERADPLAALVSFPPSFEDRPGAPDRVFAAVDDGAYERLVAAWIEVLRVPVRTQQTCFICTT
jgi:hypothetical protein